MGATQVYVALGDGSHSQLVVGSSEEGGEGAGEHHVTIPHRTADRHTHLWDEGGNDNRRSVWRVI